MRPELMNKPASLSPVDGQNQASADSGNGSDHAQYPEEQSPRTMSTASGIIHTLLTGDISEIRVYWFITQKGLNALATFQ